MPLLRPLTALVVAFFVVPASAQSAPVPDRAEQSADEPSAVGAHALAYELYAYGVQAKDALAVVSAASRMPTTPATETKLEKTRIGSAKGEDTGKATPLAVPNLAAMLATARALAGNQKSEKGTLQ